MDDDRVQHIYDELANLVVELPRDPGAVGPAFLQDLISRIRGYLNQTSVYLQEVLREKHACERELGQLEDAFQIASDDHVANNRQVSTLPAIQDRLAMVNVLLSADRRVILAKKRDIQNLGHVEQVIRHRHKELDNTMSAIRLQRGLFETEIRTGSSYGDESDESRGSRWGRAAPRNPETVSEEDIDELVRRELEGADTPTAAPAPAPEASSDEDEIAELLDATGPSEAPATPPQDVGVQATSAPNGSGSPAPAAEAEDADIQRFLGDESADEDLFKDL